MIDSLEVRARTSLSPEWDRGFDEAFAELVSSDPDLVQAEFDELIAASWPDPSDTGRPADPPPPAAGSASSSDTPTPGRTAGEPGEAAGHTEHHRPPPP